MEDRQVAKIAKRAGGDLGLPGSEREWCGGVGRPAPSACLGQGVARGGGEVGLPKMASRSSQQVLDGFTVRDGHGPIVARVDRALRIDAHGGK